jgi:hypothetical protein
MSTCPPAADVLDREFLDLRAQLLQLAASLDRVQRAAGSADLRDPRLKQIQQALDILGSGQAGRAEKIQLTFSLPYQDDWREQFGIPSSPSSD